MDAGLSCQAALWKSHWWEAGDWAGGGPSPMSSERERTGGRVEGPLARASPGATPPRGEVKSKVSLIRLADLEPRALQTLKPSRLLCHGPWRAFTMLVTDTLDILGSLTY